MSNFERKLSQKEQETSQYQSPNALAQKLKDSFHLKGLRKLGEMGLTGDYKLQALDVIKTYEKARKAEVKDYREGYEVRVSKAVKSLQNETGSLFKNLQPRFAQLDHFDASQLTLRAQKRVRQQHEVKMSLIDKQETNSLETIALNAGLEKQTPTQLIDAFYQSAQRSKSQTFNRAAKGQSSSELEQSTYEPTPKMSISRHRSR